MRKFIWTLAAVTALAGCSKKKEPAKKDEGKKPQKVAQKEEPRKTQPRQQPRPVEVKPLATEVEAVVADLSGTVTVQTPGGDAKPMTKETTVHPGDIVRTDSDGRITVVLWDDTAVDLAPDSALLVEGSDSITDPCPAITVMVGLAHIEAAKRKPGMGPLLVHTPNAAVTVTGTALDVGVGLDATAKVGVEEGTVEVTGDATLKTKPVKLPKGKALVISGDGKPAKPVAYKPDKEDWDGWLDKTNKAAVAKADVVVKAHETAIDDLKKNAQALEKAAEPVVAEAETTMAQAEKAVTAKKEKELLAVQPKVVGAIDTAAAAFETQRMFESQLQARAYLIALLAARAQAGLIKLPKPKLQAVAAGAKLFPTFRARWRNLYVRSRPKWRRLQRGYYRFHPRGWQVAPVVGVSIKPVTVDLKFKPRRYRPVRVTIPGYTMPLYRPPFMKIKIHPGVKVQLRPRGWHKRRAWAAVVKMPGIRRWHKRVVLPRLKRGHRGPRLRIRWRGPRMMAPGIRIRGAGKAGVHLRRVHLGPGGIRAPGVRIRGMGIKAGNVRIRGANIKAPGVRIRGMGIKAGNVRIRGANIKAGNVRIRGAGIKAGNVHIRGGVRVKLGGMGHRRRHGMGHGMGHM